ncbi:SusC/RagA family TonB-linked outer membrane protein [Chitinophaga eiseniae]|uniref:SusC/RagA family TonB-linked outer membrane protein n=1 Tax=Chitinophaga eiseniae TaxID=634771 RepID=A0A847SE17_9BACT|nr:SusC/RagA family TonB-linked outer membrane protein [Chitinophaga eiseniae]NLR81430.1 SusC/RagA family TonB-linked outer membrane protein [Chitinophaga eiseniae]
MASSTKCKLIGRSITIVILILITINSQSTFGNAKRQVHKITLSATNVPLKTVFKEIYQQTGLIINNNTHETSLSEDKKISVNFKQTDLPEVMKFLLNDSENLSFKINDQSVLIFKKSYINNLIPSPVNIPDTISTSFQLSGKIIDMAGNPIPGAVVRLKDTKRGAITNPDGSFKMGDVEVGNTLIITSIGFESTQFLITNKNVLIHLKSYTTILDEKVVIAYGSTTKKLNTGNITSIKGNEIEKQPVGDALLALQGRVAGVEIQQASGLPGSGVTVRIQGVNSLRNGNDPFYVIDGVPYISQLLPTNNQSAGTSGIPGITGNPLNYINLADIESIEILKDADATAIYGSRAANGAILITTKKGKVGEVRTNATVQTGWSEIGHMINMLNTKDYLAMRREALKNDGTTPSAYDWDLNGDWDTTRNTNWQKYLIGHPAQFTDIQTSVSGGTKQTQFLVGTGYNKQNTVMPGRFTDTKGSLHFNINSTSTNQKFKLQLSASYLFDNNKLPATDLTPAAVWTAPNAPNPYKPDGSFNWQPNVNGSTTFFFNPIAPLGIKSTNKTNNLTSNMVLSYEIIPGLNLINAVGYNNMSTNELLVSPLSNKAPEYLVLFNNNRYSQFLTNSINSWLIDPRIEYKRPINRGQLNTVLGTTISQQNSNQKNILAYGFNNDLAIEDLASATSLQGTTINTVYKYNAIYIRINYNWLDKYIVNLTARRDGSSRFGPASQFHNFGAIGAAWIFTQEPFIQRIFPFFSFGKIRGSYGTTGNDQISDYLFLDLYQSQTVSGNSYQNSLGLTAIRLTNPYLQWEETKKLQFGLELGILKDRMLFTANYNRNRSSNQLLDFRLPIITGFTSVTRNLPAVVQNKGWEFTISSTNIKNKNLLWTTSINLTIPKNQLLSYFGSDHYNFIKVGQPLSMQQVFNYAGLNDTTGLYEFRDSKGNLTYQPSDPTDKTVIVNSDPKFYGGLQNTVNYKGFSVNFLFQFYKKTAYDVVTYGINGYVYPGNGNYGRGNQSTLVLDRWQKEGDKATHQAFSADGSKNLSFIGNSNAAWVDASYIKLKNIFISWELPSKWKDAIHLQSAKVFIQGQNLFTITKYPGFDPETPTISLPPLRVITFGAQIIL